MVDMKIQPFGPNAIDKGEQGEQKRPTSTGESTFGDFLKQSIKDVNDLQNEADKSITDFATGHLKDIHEVMMSVQKADLSFRLMQQIRNKLVDAYREVMRMGM
jgi:flagellar hook-basal body complex protein FliE